MRSLMRIAPILMTRRFSIAFTVIFRCLQFKALQCTQASLQCGEIYNDTITTDSRKTENTKTPQDVEATTESGYVVALQTTSDKTLIYTTCFFFLLQTRGKT